ncbi:hypothetical protein Q9Q94_10285 [Uliginosibacterium sp. 31-16]|uniref:Bbp19 family protein n=1 Tax=Uliginosibacterium sp. 31-16 TaxID=3068315 RepID=UPI00273EB536|nr:hypothetical protein [Uliginosibacterium sp. 31-16]MDP5239923.1 hypothetical protein [Uliginosibacterium sp. 31-16]
MTQGITPQLYAAVFQISPDGSRVFEELTSRFYDIQSHTPGDSYETAFREGQRSVLRFVIRQLARAQQPQQEEDSSNDD